MDKNWEQAPKTYRPASRMQSAHMWPICNSLQPLSAYRWATRDQHILRNEGEGSAVVSFPDHFWSRMSPFFQLSWNSHTPLLSVVGCTPILLGLTCMLRVCLYRKEAMEWENRGVGNVSFRCGGSRSARREPPASRRLLTTFSLVDKHIGENLIQLRWPQSI